VPIEYAWNSVEHIGNTKSDMMDIYAKMFEEENIKQEHLQGPVRPKSAVSNDPMRLQTHNNDYKILARLLTNRIQAAISEILRPSQYCGEPGNNISDAVAAIRDAKPTKRR
jgi:hypothetical protein